MRRTMLLFPLVLASPALAQMGNPAGMEADTRMQAPGDPVPHQTNNQDRLFARLAATGGKAEVELAKLAGEQGSTDPVREFAARMAQDHGKGNEQLNELAKAAQIPLPDELSPEDNAMREKLGKLEGEGFDRAYMQGQVVAHQKTAQLLSWEISQGQDAEMQKFAAAMLPMVLDHLEEARQIVAALNGLLPAEATTKEPASERPPRNP